MLIKSTNYLDNDASKTQLTNPEVTGTTVIRVQNTLSMSNGWAIQLGRTGEEKAEVVLGTIVNGTQLNTGALLHDHPTDTPIYFIKYDQLVFERSTAGTAGTAAPLTNGTLTIQADSPFTQFDDTSGSVSYAYKTFFRSSGLSVNSAESAWITPAGFPFYALGALRQRAKDKLWSDQLASDDQINSWLNEHLERMNNAAVAVNEDYSLGTMDVAFSSTTGLGTITQANFKTIRRLWTTYNGVDFFQATKMDIIDYTPNQQFSSTRPMVYMQGDSVFGIQPPDIGGTARIVYYQNSTQLANDDDNLPFPMRGYTQSFVDYALAMAYQKDGKLDEGKNILTTNVIPAIGAFRQEISPRNKTGNNYMKLTEMVTGEDFGI